jgi:hypothetical protein
MRPPCRATKSRVRFPAPLVAPGAHLRLSGVLGVRFRTRPAVGLITPWDEACLACAFVEVGLVVRFVRVIRVSPVSGVSPGSRTVHVISNIKNTWNMHDR